MAITRSQTQGPMTRARAAAANKSTTTKTKKLTTPRKPTKKKNRAPAPRPRARRAAAVAAIIQGQQDEVPVAIVQDQQDAAPAASTHDYVYTKMQTLAMSASAEHWAALRELIRRNDTFDQFHDTLASLDAAVEYAGEGGQQVEDRDMAFSNAAAEFFHE